MQCTTKVQYKGLGLTAIVLISILQKVVSDKNLRIWYAALIVIALTVAGSTL